MYALISFSHKKLDISVREKIALPQNELENFYQLFLSTFPKVQECIVLTTCNRFEILLYGELAESDLEEMVSFIASHRGIESASLKEGVEFYLQERAVWHIFKVASSLDSLVVGETQITGQLKNAYRYSFDHGFCKKALTRVVHFAFKTAALVRNQTQISKNPVSVASVAVAKFLQCQPDRMQKVVVVGSGEIGSLCAKHLLANGFEIILLSGQIQNAQKLAEELGEGVGVADFSELKNLLNLHPYVFSATGAPHAVITQDMIESEDSRRLWFDLALPRDIEEMSGAQIFVIDDLQEIVNENISKREEELQNAYKIVQNQISEFYQWIKSLDVEPIIKSFRDKAKECCHLELERAIKKGFLPKEQYENVERILHNAFNKFLHHPTTYIKTIKENPESDFILGNVKKLFDLQDFEIYQNPYNCEGYYKNKKD